MGQKKPKNPGLEEFTKSKVFVMTRPHDDNPALQLTTEDINNFNQQLTELYNSALYDYLFNSQLILKNRDYRQLLWSITPTLAAKYHENQPAESLAMVKDYLQALKRRDPEEYEFVNNLPDVSSQLDYLFRYTFLLVQRTIKFGSLEQALEEYEVFIHDISRLFYSLPAAYAFALINVATQFINKPTKPKKKTKKV